MDALMTVPTGSLGDEAARLVEALTTWARDRSSDIPIATGGDECTLCPFCQLLSLARRTQPETFTHLADAVTALAAAARSVVEGHPHGDGNGRAGVQRIDLDEEPRE
jgi:hypothetical protein